MKILGLAVVALAALLALGWLGLRIQPAPLPAYAGRGADPEEVPLPEGLPAPVERYYRTVYGDRVPVIETVVFTGRATMRPFLELPLPARFVFTHNAGHDYRH